MKKSDEKLSIFGTNLIEKNYLIVTYYLKHYNKAKFFLNVDINFSLNAKIQVEERWKKQERIIYHVL